jgi:hypothetical protein
MANPTKDDRECNNARLVLEYFFKFYLDREFKKKVIENFKHKQNLSKEEKEQIVSISHEVSHEGEFWKISGKFYSKLRRELIEGFNYQVLYDFMDEEHREKIMIPTRGEKKDEQGKIIEALVERLSEKKIKALTNAFYWLIDQDFIKDKAKEQHHARLFEGLEDIKIKGGNLSFDAVNKQLDDIFAPYSSLNLDKRKAEFANEAQPNPSPSEQDAYLILQIITSKYSNSKNKKYDMLAWFDNGIRTKQLGQENGISEIKRQLILGQWVGQSRQEMAENNNQRLLIEIYVSDDLLNETYEHWEYHCRDLLPEQLRERYRVYIRWQKRWSLAKEFNYQNIWQNRWNKFTASQMLHPHTDEDWERHIREEHNLWFNASRIGSSIKDSVKKFTMHGMPIALWSRCRHADHWDAINSLVVGSNGSQLLTDVFNLRLGASTKISENSTELGHHLTLMWEDPHRCHPWVDDVPCDNESIFPSS